MELTNLLVADYAAFDTSRKINIIGAFRKISSREFPFLYPQMYLFIELNPALGEYGETRKLRIRLVDEDGKEIAHVATPITLVRQEPYYTIVGISNIEFSHPGRHEFRVILDKDHKGSLPIEVEAWDASAGES